MQKRKRIKLNHFLYYIVVAWISYFILSIVFVSYDTWPAPIKEHSPINLTGLKQRWTLANVYARQDAFSPMMVSNSGYVFVNGGLTRFAGEIVICLVSSNGAVLWQKSDRRIATALFAATDGMYVGYSGMPHVNKYELSL